MEGQSERSGKVGLCWIDNILDLILDSGHLGAGEGVKLKGGADQGGEQEDGQEAVTMHFLLVQND